MHPTQNTFLKRALRPSHQEMQSILLPFNLGELVQVQSIEYSAGAGVWPLGWVSNPVVLLWSQSFETLILWTLPLGCSPTETPHCAMGLLTHMEGPWLEVPDNSPSWVQPLSFPRPDTRHVSEELSRWLQPSDIWKCLSRGPRSSLAVPSHPCWALSEFLTSRISERNAITQFYGN